MRGPAVEANATSTVALWPGMAASTIAYLKRLNVPPRVLIPLLITSIGGGFAGALLLLHTPQRTFLHLIPWLLLAGTLLFAFGNKIRALTGQTGVINDLGQLSWRAITRTSIVELLAAVYGGYFGAGIGFVLLAMLATLGMRDVHAMGAIRSLLAVLINGAAVVTFILAGAVLWSQCVVMIAGAVAGGWFGAHYVQKVDSEKVRRVVIAIGIAMTVY